MSSLLTEHFPDPGQERLDTLLRRLDDHLAVPEASHRLAQEIEAVFATRDSGLLVGEFETPLRQELLHERLHFILKENLGRACDDESSSPGELHPQALAEPDVELSPHPALMIQSPV